MLKKKVYFRTLLFSIVFFTFLFLPAGSLNFWEAWIYFVIFLGSTYFINGYFLKRDPKLIERRTISKEKEKEQKIFQTISGITFFVGLLVLPGLDYRFGWSSFPLFIVFVADVIILLGFSIVFLVFKENSYTSAIIEVTENQKVISTGPYALVRHPMYTGAIFIILFTPLALSSIWALIPSISIIIFIVLRLLNEEKVLLKELKGYEDYCKKTRYHLIPLIW
ncbi:isoprenylcysteine carboxylmethyltransferase family protein [Paenibacillus alba]|uniref:methyltransferase family protein n=1 Tax=Paenibacillus alba TaxID=1197127 RepID=UPI0015643AF6|nr:isoprenylcysteine carboxylmethyltransferase family protein [Paenibacillus alba]NQX71609.1 isoprenylcysteine carboxylmethyltransferase family protein [Paenibacillus alba]